MRWYISRTGQAEGPFDEADLIGWVRSGDIRDAHVCREGGSEWSELASCEPFASAMRSGSASGSAPKSSEPSTRASAVSPVSPRKPGAILAAMEQEPHDLGSTRPDALAEQRARALRDSAAFAAPTHRLGSGARPARPSSPNIAIPKRQPAVTARSAVHVEQPPLIDSSGLPSSGEQPVGAVDAATASQALASSGGWVPASSGVQSVQPPTERDEHPKSADRGLGGTLKMDDDDLPDSEVDDSVPEPDFSSGRTPSQIPPAEPPDAIGRIHLPPGRRTPSVPLDAPDFSGPLPANAPPWMHHAQRMIAGLRAALHEGTVSPSVQASIERAWAGWELDGSSERQVARLGLLIEQAHHRIRDAADADRERVMRECSEIVYRGVPRHRRKQLHAEQVAEAIRGLRDEADPWVAVVNSTATLLGWGDQARAHAAHCLRLAILNYRRK